MAKKRVHEIAKERGIPSKEVLAKLQAAGLDVKAAASSVDEADIERAFGGGDGDAQAASSSNGPAGDGAAEQSQSAPQGSSRRPEPPRPTRGESGPGPGGRRRRVVIDSQAGRGRPGGPPPPQQPVRRGRGRRRRPQWVEPDLNAVPEVVEQPPTEIQSGATVGQVAESLGLSPPEAIKRPMELGELLPLTQTLTDDAIEVLAD